MTHRPPLTLSMHATMALLILFVSFLYAPASAIPLSGNYTINSGAPASATNFQSFNDFSTSLTANGIAGNVIADVVSGSGPYNEQVVFQSIAGTGASSTITIEGNGETITAVTSSTARHVIRLTDLQYFTINNLSVSWNPTSGGGFYGIHIFNTGNHITISNCTIDISGTSSTLYGSIVASGSETSILTTGDFHDINITGNTTTGGGYGVSVFGLVSNLASGINISNNTIYDFHSNGIYLRETDGAVISNNTLDKRTSNVTTANAIQIAQSANINAQIFNNVISVSQTSNGSSTLRGIYLFGGTGHLVYNNVIHDISLVSGNFTGIEIRAASSAPLIYFNTIAIDNAGQASGNLTGIGEELSNTNSVVMNNIISIAQPALGDKAGLVLGSISNITSALNSNYNIIYVPGGDVALKSGLSAVHYQTLADWQLASSHDLNSRSVDPLFTSSSLSIPSNSLADNAGTSIPNILIDITGATRAVPPDAGAYEFTATGIAETAIINLKCFPVPASEYLNIQGQWTAPWLKAELFTLDGRKAGAQYCPVVNGIISLDVALLAPGNYIVKINSMTASFSVGH